jgi:hypothetical protein
VIRRTAPAALVIAALFAAAPAAAQGPGPPDSARMVSVRMWQYGQFTARHESPESIGAALASLRPTFVSSLMRYDKNEAVTKRQVANWNTVLAAVRAASPTAKFDVELDGLQYRSAGQVRRTMRVIRSKLDPDGWLIDFYTTGAREHPDVWKAALESAHANGEFLGGNAFGITEHPAVPKGTDYEAVQDSDMKVNLPATRELAKRVTTFMHLGNDPYRQDSDGCTFIEDFTTEQRIAYVRKRGGQQAKYDFRFEYPVFFPECARNRERQTPTVFTYNATRDKPMMPSIGELLDRYEPSASAFSLLP